ncbi:hypothetical protein BST61_g7048 [Cercospora zeina]
MVHEMINVRVQSRKSLHNPGSHLRICRLSVQSSSVEVVAISVRWMWLLVSAVRDWSQSYRAQKQSQRLRHLPLSCSTNNHNFDHTEIYSASAIKLLVLRLEIQRAKALWARTSFWIVRMAFSPMACLVVALLVVLAGSMDTTANGLPGGCAVGCACGLNGYHCPRLAASPVVHVKRSHNHHGEPYEQHVLYHLHYDGHHFLVALEHCNGTGARHAQYDSRGRPYKYHYCHDHHCIFRGALELKLNSNCNHINLQISRATTAVLNTTGVTSGLRYLSGTLGENVGCRTEH